MDISCAFAPVTEWRTAIEAIDPEIRHLSTHEGHLTFINDIDREVINGDHIRDYTFTGEAHILRQKLEELEAQTVSEIAFQPAGPDLPRELRAFAKMAGM